MPIKLKCGCIVTENGTFVLGNHCKTRCKECNLISELHPFGNKRLA